MTMTTLRVTLPLEGNRGALYAQFDLSGTGSLDRETRGLLRQLIDLLRDHGRIELAVLEAIRQQVAREAEVLMLVERGTQRYADRLERELALKKPSLLARFFGI